RHAAGAVGDRAGDRASAVGAQEARGSVRRGRLTPAFGGGGRRRPPGRDGTFARGGRSPLRIQQGRTSLALFSSRDSNYDIHRDIEALRREIATLSRTASKRGSAALRGAADEASGLYDDVAERFNNALPVIRRR